MLECSRYPSQNSLSRYHSSNWGQLTPPYDSVYPLDNIDPKPLTLEGTLQIRSGKAEACPCTDFLNSFLDQLRDEIG
jgi:hypothetical protein